MTRSTLFLSVSLAAGVSMMTVLGCSGDGGDGGGGNGGGVAGSSAGGSGAAGMGGGGPAGSGGSGPAGSGPAGSGGSGPAGSGGTGPAGSGGSGPAGAGGGTAGRGGAAGGTAGRGGAAGGTTGAGGGAAGRGGTGGGAAGRGGAGGAAGASGGTGGATTTLTLTSPTITNGAMIPATHTCAGANTSPELNWTEGPAGTLSYAIVLTDMTNMLVHWAIWDIPPATRSLPAALPNPYMLTAPAGAKQASFGGHGYQGSCPGGQTHTYQFVVYALNVGTVPNLTMTSSQMVAAEAIVMPTRVLASGSLTGTSNASRTPQP